jgi:hypothetical protein
LLLSALVPFATQVPPRVGLATSPKNFVFGIYKLLDTLSTDQLTTDRDSVADTLPRVTMLIDRIRLGCFCITTTRTHPDVQSSIFGASPNFQDPKVVKRFLYGFVSVLGDQQAFQP